MDCVCDNNGARWSIEHNQAAPPVGVLFLLGLDVVPLTRVLASKWKSQLFDINAVCIGLPRVGRAHGD